jgi:endonuclease-3
MPTTTNKQRVLTHLFTSLKKRYGDSDPEPRPVLEQLIYAILREGSTRELADQSFRLLRERFFDWNEIRVSSVREIEEALACLPNAELRAQRLISLLQEVFETTFSFDLEILHKKGVKQAAKQLNRYQAINDYAIAWVIQQSLGGHAVPLDDPSERCLRRLGLVEGEQEQMESLRGSVEHLIPKARAPLFNELVSAIANDVCGEEPRCSACPLCQECPTGQELRHRPVAAERGSRPKSR